MDMFPSARGVKHALSSVFLNLLTLTLVAAHETSE